jgi:uncharacterized protein with PQ loop repeat
MEKLFIFLVGGFVLISIINHGRQLGKSEIVPIKLWGGITMILGLVLMIIFVVTLVSTLFD